LHFRKSLKGGLVTDNPKNQLNRDEGEGSLQAITDFCRELVAALHMDLLLEGKVEDDAIQLNLTGPDRPFLLSNNASLLNGIEFLLNRVFRLSRDEIPAIILDSDNYRKHREAELVLLAQMASKKVLSFGKPLSLQPMVPRERRIVHLALAGIEGVHSQSNGEGENRSITIYPS
jgi:spoIIIJ-associated protein